MTAPGTTALFDTYGFDAVRFAEQQAEVRAHGYDPAAAIITDPIAALTPHDFVRLAEPASAAHRELSALGTQALREGKVAAVLLNGGMATRFGGVAKGAANALGTRSFLDLRLTQLQDAGAQAGAPVPVVLMTSFATHEATAAHLREHARFGLREEDILYAPQGISQRLTDRGDIFVEDNGTPSFYAPGHGDLPWALARSGAAEKLKARGVTVLFVSNVDNLGCTLDPALIGAHLRGAQPMTVELCDRLAGDVGGAPARVAGRVQLVEGFRMPAAFPPQELIGFNTNTFYFGWSALDPAIALGFYAVAKKVSGRTAIQFERIVGELSRTVGCQLLLVPRDPEQGRFLPVKTPEDLQSLQPLLTRRFSRA